jgi:hypothetical protein
MSSPLKCVTFKNLSQPFIYGGCRAFFSRLTGQVVTRAISGDPRGKECHGDRSDALYRRVSGFYSEEVMEALILILRFTVKGTARIRSALPPLKGVLVST